VQCLSPRTQGAAEVLQRCYKGFTRVLQDVIRVLDRNVIRVLDRIAGSAMSVATNGVCLRVFVRGSVGKEGDGECSEC
jgi:hypothetical protein